MSDGFLKKHSPRSHLHDTNTLKATEECMEDIYDRCQVLTLDAEGLHADEHAVEIVENYMEEDIDLILAVGSGTIHDISRYLAYQYKIPFISVPTAASGMIRIRNIAQNDLKGLKKASTAGLSCVC